MLRPVLFVVAFPCYLSQHRLYLRLPELRQSKILHNNGNSFIDNEIVMNLHIKLGK